MAEKEQRRNLSGDTLVTDNVVEWDTTITVDGSVDQSWAWLSRLGPMKEGRAGWLTPRFLDRILPSKSLFSQSERDQLSQLQVDDTVTDKRKKKGPPAVVKEVIEGEQTKTISFQSHWFPRKSGEGIPYTWQVVVEEGDIPGETTVFTRSRLGNIKKKRTLQRLGPLVDRLAMGIIKKGLNERLKNGDLR